MMLPAALPPLREELSIHPGPSLATGEPSRILEDPVRNQFYRIDWLTFEILQRWSLGNAADILLSIRTATPLNAAIDDVQAVLQFLGENQLLRPDARLAARQMAERHRKMQGTWFNKLLHHYLFFRIPLVKPDRWLTRVTPRFEWIFSSLFLRLTLAALVFGVIQVYRDWEHFSATFVDTFTPTGLLAYALALIGVKCAHELGHAITAKRYGCRVPTMGVAFLVLWPMPYTDTNDVWRLGDKHKRQRVAAAGVTTELVIAIWSTLAWVLLPDGLLRSIAFPLATTTWIATLAINFSPFMRFDGYFLVSDWLDMPNLHARAFALARWDLRERLFALGAPPPEHFPRTRHTGLILFAWGTWLYRLLLFLGIAVLVYHFFIKFVGIFLAIVEIMWFIVRPVANEFSEWRKLWPQVRASGRARLNVLLLLVLVGALFVPWPTRVQATAVLRAAAVYPLHAPRAAQVIALPLREGQAVEQGQLLLQLSSAELAGRRQALEATLERLRWQSSAVDFDTEQRGRGGVLREELGTAEAELASLEQEEARMQPVAPFAGRLRDLEPELAPGVWVGKKEKLAVLVADGTPEVEAYLDEETVRRVSVGDGARFYADGLEGPFVKLRVARIDHDATRVLPNAMWAAQHGGLIPAREMRGTWVPERAVYRVALTPEEGAGKLEGQAWRGTVVIAGDAEAPGLRFLRAMLAVVWREAGF